VEGSVDPCTAVMAYSAMSKVVYDSGSGDKHKCLQRPNHKILAVTDVMETCGGPGYSGATVQQHLLPKQLQ